MLTFCIVLTLCLCASLAACFYLYATQKANTRLVRRQDKQSAALERRCVALLDKVLQRHGSAPISTPVESVPESRSFIPSDPWEQHWDELDKMDEEKREAYSLLQVPDLTDEQKAELRARLRRVSS